MSIPPDGQVTRTFEGDEERDPSAADKLFPLVYQELHRLAAAYMHRERRPNILSARDRFIDEAYLRLAREDVDWQNHQHFIRGSCECDASRARRSCAGTQGSYARRRLCAGRAG